MKIMHIIPGSGGTFYCDNCLRDKILIQTLRSMGHDVIMVPMYLPTSVFDPDPTEGVPIFFGAISTYLKQMIPLFRKAPRWMEKLLDSGPLLQWAAKQAGSTRAKGLAEMTVSMLKGEEGNQADDLDRLITWLAQETKPDVIYLANALLLGLARKIKEKLGVPIVCALQNEHVWIDVMEGDYPRIIREMISERAKYVDMFLPVSRTYAETMKKSLYLPEEKIRVMSLGIDPAGYKQTDLEFNPPVIGYLARLCECMGLDVLIDAFILLKQKEEFSSVRLHLSGGYTGDDRKFIKRMKKKLSGNGLMKDVKFFPRFMQPDRIQFLQSLSVFSVPVVEEDAFGLFQLEALVSGVPLVQPKQGAFPELIEATGGGICYEPNTAEALAGSLAEILKNPNRARELGKKGRESVLNGFTHKHMAKKLFDVYQSLVI